MTEDKPEYVTQDDIDDADEMLGAGYEHRITDESNDHKYFIITPRIIQAYARGPHDLALWHAVKDVAGEAGECYLSTSDLAVLCDMSAGQVSKSRAYWLKTGFLKGSLRRDPGYPQPVWHLSVPDVWGKNVKWCEEHPRISDRLAHKKSLHQVKASPGEGGITYSEGGITPGETKKSNKKIEKGERERPALDFASMTVSEAYGIPELALYARATGFFPPAVLWQYVRDRIADSGISEDKLKVAAVAWAARGFKPQNVQGILDWAIGGVPENGKVAVEVPHPERKPFEPKPDPKYVPPPVGLMERFKQTVKSKEVKNG